jgi:hypothetical protein
VRFGLGVAAARTRLDLGGGQVGLEQLAMTATLQVHLDGKKTLSAGGGALLGGTLFTGSGPYPLGPGSTASIGYSQLLLEPKGAVPFVQVSGSAAVTQAPASMGYHYTAFDLRAAVAAGWLLWDRFTPYATVRVFGGPVYFRGYVGGDLYHFQLGAGFVLGLPGGFDLVAECVPLGEQALSAGFGFSF